MADRDHMREETKQMLLSDNLDFMIGVIIVIIFILVIRKKAKQFWKKREQIRATERLCSKWGKLKGKDLENKITEKTCNICLEDFKDHDKVIQLKCN